MKKIFLSLLVICFVFAETKLKPNVILNPDMNDNLDDITSSLENSAAASHNTTTPITGAGCLNIVQTIASGANWQPYIMFAKNNTFTVGDSFYVSFNIRVNSGTCRIYMLRLGNQNNNIIFGEDVIMPSLGLATDYKIALNMADTLNFSTTGTVYIDAITIGTI